MLYANLTVQTQLSIEGSIGIRSWSQYRGGVPFVLPRSPMWGVGCKESHGEGAGTRYLSGRSPLGVSVNGSNTSQASRYLHNRRDYIPGISAGINPFLLFKKRGFVLGDRKLGKFSACQPRNILEDSQISLYKRHYRTHQHRQLI